jgi:F0F1-type ATP synthase gamma subunit
MMKKEITVEELLDVVDSTIEMYNSEWDKLTLNFNEFIESKKEITVQELLNVVDNTFVELYPSDWDKLLLAFTKFLENKGMI